MNSNDSKLPIQASYSFKLVRVPVELDLHTVLFALKGKLVTLVNAYRVCDYVNKQRCDEVFVTVRSKMEYDTLKEMKIVLIGQHEISLEFMNIYAGVATRFKYNNSSNDQEFGPSPVSLKLNELTEVYKFTTVYMIKILTAFESKNNKEITGLSLIYDEWRDSTRPFGFLSFMDKESMQKYHKKNVRMFEEYIYCEGSHQVPIVLSEPNKVLLGESPFKFTKEICAANMLHDTPLSRCGSHSSLTNAVESMILDESIPPIDDAHSDSESVLSLEFDYEFDEHFDLVKKF